MEWDELQHGGPRWNESTRGGSRVPTQHHIKVITGWGSWLLHGFQEQLLPFCIRRSCRESNTLHWPQPLTHCTISPGIFGNRYQWALGLCISLCMCVCMGTEVRGQHWDAIPYIHSLSLAHWLCKAGWLETQEICLSTALQGIQLSPAYLFLLLLGC